MNGKFFSAFVLCCGIAAAVTPGFSSPENIRASSEESASIVANVQFPKNDLTRKEILRILSLKPVKAGNLTIRPLILAGEPHCLKRIYALIGLTEKDMKLYWLKVTFAGRGFPPEIMKSEDEMVTRVKSSVEAIGFVCGDTELKDVKKIKIADY